MQRDAFEYRSQRPMFTRSAPFYRPHACELDKPAPPYLPSVKQSFLGNVGVNSDLTSSDLDRARPFLAADSDFEDVFPGNEGYVRWCVPKELSIDIDFGPAGRRRDVNLCFLQWGAGRL